MNLNGRNLTYLYAVKAETAIMRLNAHIEEDPGNKNAPFISAARFIDEMNWIKSQNKHVQVRINSPGGHVNKGWDIYDAIVTANADTHCYGIAASMAGIIMLGGKKRTADSHAVGMFHGPHVIDDQGNPAPDNPMTGRTRAGFKHILASATSLTPEHIDRIMDNGDHFFDASQMLENGIIDKIIQSTMQPPSRMNASATKLFQVYNSLVETTNPQQMEGEKTLASFLLGLFGKSTEAENMMAAAKMKSDLASAEAKVGTLSLEIGTLKAKVLTLESAAAEVGKVDAKAKATKLIEDAIAAKKLVVLDAAQKNNFIEMATTNFDGVKLMLDGMKGVVGKTHAAAEIVSPEKGDPEKRSYAYMAVHAPKELAALADADPERFQQMQDDYIAEEKKRIEKKAK